MLWPASSQHQGARCAVLVAVPVRARILAPVTLGDLRAIAMRGKKSAMDAVLIVLSIGATIFSLVVLLSLLLFADRPACCRRPCRAWMVVLATR